MRLLAACSLAMLLALSACGNDQSSEVPAPQSASDETGTEPKTAPPRFARFVELTPCPARNLPHGGGYEVRVRGLGCAEVGELLPTLGLPIGRNDPHAGIFERGGEWTCWSQYLDRNGPVQNVCWQDDKLVVYKVA